MHKIHNGATWRMSNQPKSSQRKVVQEKANIQRQTNEYE